ncbi:MAG TPA: ribonuclease R [Casimicrobiaceae bacterium]|nr:ribonuclease R [Casimicrobiaceae bacterium]
MSKKPHAPAPRKHGSARPRDGADDLDPSLLPSRTDILAALRDAGVPLPPAELARAMAVDRRARTAFFGRIDAMQRDGELLANRKGELCVVAKLDLLTGTVQGHPDGYGFLVPDDGGTDLFLDPREMHKVLHGDRATARRAGTDRRGRPEGEIVDVLQRANTTIVGRLHEERGIAFVVAENRRINQDLLVPPDERGGAKTGDVVVVEIVEQPTSQREAIVRVAEVLGSYTDPGMEIEIALRKHDLPHVFSTAAERQAHRLPAEVRAADRNGRIDLTALPLVTIDGETAKDFDDAVYCDRTARGFRLIVAIADVSHYVRDGDALDRDARERGTSVYFPRRVIPMLPEALSNELCSLKPAVDRLCMACEMDIDGEGAIAGYRFYPAVMHSQARLTYTQVWAALSQPKKASRETKPVLPQLQDLYALYHALKAAREARGAIDFDTVEMQLEFDVRGKIVRIVPVVRNDAHKLIEECMLAANVCTAQFLERHKHPTLYRVHEGPTPEKLAALRDFLAGSALSLGGGDDPTAADYARLLLAIKDRPDYALLQTVLLRSLQQARYRPDNVGHFGLSYEAYAHFTSPIRRYPDLLVHRAIKAVLATTVYAPGGASWAELGEHCSFTERRADDATRDVENWLKCYYMQDKIGESFGGTISGVTSFGIFVTLDDLAIDGLVHVTELGRDYFQFDATRHALVGERSGRVFQLAGRVRVTVARVDLESTKIDFALAADAEVPAGRAHGELLARQDRGKKRSSRA